MWSVWKRSTAAMRSSAVFSPEIVTQASPKRLACLVRPSREGGEDDDLLARGEHVPDPLLDGLVLGLVQRDADLGELGQERRVVGPARVRGGEPFARRRAAHSAPPALSTATGTQERILGGRSSTSSFSRRRITSFISRFSSSRLEAPVGHPAVVVAVGGAVALGEGR